ncbi:MAG: cytochrome c [Candidatus Andeanibacterium colombiense]|uniref:Cytochrome c n=1 Tax=Candidatus Andeanibacterium colombiense TaxID=3121345 RepID=A0AAJ6BQV4_9SPHN|nr:MAG: cytochrome c [Sphingomonadaceae bacterium]
MVRLGGRIFGIVIVCGALAGCLAPLASTSGVNIHTTMVDGVDPAAVAIWSLSSRAMSEASGSRQTRMNRDAWIRLEMAAEQLARNAGRLADATTLRVGAHGDPLEGFANSAEIQARIDADPAQFRRLARDAAEQSATLAAAARAKNIGQSQALTKSLYNNCLACHSRYWVQTS